jgi:hypothetical protein
VRDGVKLPELGGEVRPVTPPQQGLRPTERVHDASLHHDRE